MTLARGILAALAALLLAPSGADAAALVPLAPPSAWGTAPIHATAPAGDTRVFVVERGGAIRIVSGGVLRPTPFLTIPGVATGGERGLLSMAFAPDYATSRRFYVFYVAGGTTARIRIAEYRTSGDPNVADPSSARTVIEQTLGSATNHNGGQIAFGPDGKLYIAIGENANPSNAQTLTNLLGKILRIDPADPDGPGGASYSVPTDNPFVVGSPGARPEVWALGLRNPYRAGFDPAGRLIIGDVGQDDWEELDVGASGANYGWPTCEGTCTTTGLVNPLHAYSHAGPLGGCAVISGHVVRDPRLTGLTGRYLFGDFCVAALRTIDLGSPATAQPAGLTLASSHTLTSFGEDAQGCIYVMGDATAYRVAANRTDSAACAPAPGGGTTPQPDPVTPRPVPTTTGPPAAAGGGTTTAPPGRARLLAGALRADARGRVRVSVLCAGTTSCSGRIQLQSAQRLRLPGVRRARLVTFGTARFSGAKPGGTLRVRLVLTAAAQRLLRTRDQVRVKVILRRTTPRGFVVKTARSTSLSGP
ncbi:MAG: PQQ-dependent sugar dehydrogenase [Solirubrobacteraceae bacterium]|nr:PQQ-dependent sugar dehydrogenase [Solirubrobacteraceae bacterium]